MPAAPPLSNLLTDENITAVAELDLYPECDGYELRRGRELLKAWLSPQYGSFQ